MDRENMVKSVSRALDIVDLLSMKKNGLGVTEIANQMDINKSSVHRILATLVKYGYVEQDIDTGRYKLGYKFLEINSKLLDSIDLRTEAHPFLEQLEKETNEVIHLVVYDNGEVVYIEKLDGNETLRMHSKVGKRAPMHCTAVGKAILSHIPINEVLNILQKKGLPDHTDHTMTNLDEFLNHLVNVKEQGYALDMEENEYGIRCVAVPIFDHSSKVIAAVSISGPTLRMTDDRLQELKQRMIEVGQHISIRLGFQSL
ncbi:IclR family transcriptional regulator [Bacillus sp. HMF5848]|uniref:IclR family transcriptional regulator n=1 Tax=Bacillus sp. HMF5848 TaxID=2495421 RepID=UPI000F7ADFF0|nr:IclR family transcriptional regulator [Bacillus sp. HMF5848]RSK27205.1 IclR family transcriptional regulator [Bacillus sp. HMF5848]